MSKINYITMNSLLRDCEFFSHEEEVWLRTSDGEMRKLTEADADLVEEIASLIELFYPIAYAALCGEYKSSAPNRRYFLFRIVCRFIRCNFAQLDSTPDITRHGLFNFEHINCPMRGECRHDHVVCRPEFDHRLSPAELRVMKLIYEGYTEEEAGECLKLSPLTIHTHVRNAYVRLGIHSKAAFVRYAAEHNLFT